MIKGLPEIIQKYLYSNNKPFIELAVEYINNNLSTFVEKSDIILEYENRNKISYDYDENKGIWKYSVPYINDNNLFLNSENIILVLNNVDYSSLKLAEAINKDEQAMIWGIKAKAINLENNVQ